MQVGSNRSLPRGENLTMTPQGSLPPFRYEASEKKLCLKEPGYLHGIPSCRRSPAHTPSLSSATSRAQSADPTQLSDRRLRASKTLVATADEFAIPLGAQVRDSTCKCFLFYRVLDFLVRYINFCINSDQIHVGGPCSREQ